jgi:purine-cytosine permease-like protein
MMHVINSIVALLGLVLALWGAHAHDFYSMFTGIIVLLSSSAADIIRELRETKHK